MFIFDMRFSVQSSLLLVWLVVVATPFFPSSLLAQAVVQGKDSTERVVELELNPAPRPFDPWVPEAHRVQFFPLIAGKYEARIAGMTDLGQDRLRLDIGASTDLFSTDVETVWTGSAPYRYGYSSTLTFGVDFFTWTRLRDAGGFKFPVEAVDYYFGVNAVYYDPMSSISDYRLRVGHISAHLVDGDPSFSTDSARYMTYSREFVDLTVRAGDNMKGRFEFFGLPISPYVGVQYLFHTIPDTLGRITPYIGCESVVQTDGLLSLIVGYELRVNSELETTVEHLVRLGVKLGEAYESAVALDARYYNGRSPFGQHFNQMEKYFSLGFAIDF